MFNHSRLSQSKPFTYTKWCQFHRCDCSKPSNDCTRNSTIFSIVHYIILLHFQFHAIFKWENRLNSYDLSFIQGLLELNRCRNVSLIRASFWIFGWHLRKKNSGRIKPNFQVFEEEEAKKVRRALTTTIYSYFANDTKN